MLEKPIELYGRFREKAEQHGYRRASKMATQYVMKRGIRATISPLYQAPSIYLHSRLNDRWNVFNEEWDLLIILDTCRPDALRHVADEYEFIRGVDTRWSVGGGSPEWIANTFDRRYQDDIAETAYITANPHARTVLEERLKRNYTGESFNNKSRDRVARYNVTDWVTPDTFHTYIPLYDVSTDYGETKYPSPRAVTDHVIETSRNEAPDRIIAHYMPPHTPYLAKAQDGSIDILDTPRPVTFEAYLDNLRWGLAEVELLLDNVDRDRVILSADHGENFRLRGIRPGHRNGMFVPSVRRVPWVETSACDESTYEPDLSADSEQESMTPEETLEALGYLT